MNSMFDGSANGNTTSWLMEELKLADIGKYSDVHGAANVSSEHID
jgi:hypothetical protein